MKKLFIYCFKEWWRPIFFFAFILGLVIINSELNIYFLKKPLIIFANFSVVVLLISFFYQIYKRELWKGCVNLIILLITGVISMLISIFGEDHWADDLKIPKGIQIENTVNLDNHSRPDSILRLKKTQPDLVIYNSDQPGMYKYDFWTGRIENGTVYLKAFEITKEEELSAENVKKESEISINNSSDSIIRFSSTSNFKIYEGDWGKFYAARFELWFKPSSGGSERKLFQKNFKIEGWMH